MKNSVYATGNMNGSKAIKLTTAIKRGWIRQECFMM